MGRKLFGLIVNKANIVISLFYDKQGLFIQIKVPFQSPMMTSGSLPRIKLDLTKNEVLIDKPHSSLLIHDYSDSEKVATLIQSYSMDEIFSEKCRALVERTRPRDLYDIIQIFERHYHSTENLEVFLRIVELKFSYKGLSFPEDFFTISKEQFAETTASWAHMLSHQIGQLDPIETYLIKYKSVTE